MEKVIIEVLKEKDIDEYSALINEVMNEFNKEEVDGFQIWFASVDGIKERRSWNTPENKYETMQFTAKINGKIIGALEIENANHIQNFFVKKEYQKSGIGKKLFDYSKMFFINKGIEINIMTVLSSDFAINFYKKLGFTGNGKFLHLEMGYRRIERTKLAYNVFLRRLAGLWSSRRKYKAVSKKFYVN